MTDHRNGEYFQFDLDISYLLDFMFDVFQKAGLIFLVFATLFFLWDVRANRLFPIRCSAHLILILIICISFIKLIGIDVPITIMLALMRTAFLDPAWQIVGILLCSLIFLPLALRIQRRERSRRQWQYIIPILSFLLMVLMLYLPFGFQSIGHWETWYYRAYLEGLQSRSAATELVTRFWVMLPHRLALIISTESYYSFHFVHIMISWFKLAFLFGVLRQLRFTGLHAFLITTLFLVYPVNSHLLSLRSIPNSFSVMCLLAGVFMMLDYIRHPSRIHILGIWLALTLNIVTQETGYFLILLIPLLWHANVLPTKQRKLNLSAIWYLFPVYKIYYLTLLFTSNRSFYRKGLFTSFAESESFLSNLMTVFPNIIDVYRHLFIDGWMQAVATLDHAKWFQITFLLLGLIIVVSSWLSRSQLSIDYACTRRMAISCVVGLLLILPSVGILIWFEYYRNDLWRTYFYPPIFAAIVLFCLIKLITTPIKRAPTRNVAVILLCICLIFPAFVRLMSQHEQLIKSAGDKAFVLEQIVNSAPAFDSKAKVILWSMMSREELEDKLVRELSTKMLNSAIYVLYQKKSPNQAIFCIFGDDCYPRDGELTDIEFQNDSDYSNIVLFRLNEDLSVELHYELPSELGAEVNKTYNVGRLVELTAPIPPRANSMLGLSKE